MPELNGTYIYESADWPTIPMNRGLPSYFRILPVNGGDRPQLWIPNVHVRQEDNTLWQFLVNVCKIANRDIEKLYQGAHVLANTPIEEQHLSHENSILEQVANSWNILLRLRLTCDVAIKLWVHSPNNPVSLANPDKLDSVGRLLNNSCALQALRLSEHAKFYLKFLNDAVNEIKHPPRQNDLVSRDNQPKVVIYSRGINTFVLQPIPDLIAGTTRFLIRIFSQIAVS